MVETNNYNNHKMLLKTRFNFMGYQNAGEFITEKKGLMQFVYGIHFSTWDTLC